MKITKQSLLSFKRHTLDIPISEEDYNKFCNGMSIQDAAPYLSKSDREFLISGITEQEWNQAFPKEEEEI